MIRETALMKFFNRFVSLFVLVAQLDRVSDSDSEGRWFDSSRAHHALWILVTPYIHKAFLKF